MRTITSSNPNWPLRFDYPENWEPRELLQENGASFFLRGPIQPEAKLFPSITVEARPGKAGTLPELQRDWTTRRSILRTFRILTSGDAALAGMKAVQLDIAYEMPYPLHSRTPQIITVREHVILAREGERIYEICYRTAEDDFDEFQGVFDALAASFSLETPILT
jgi:hypothetical protein